MAWQRFFETGLEERYVGEFGILRSYSRIALRNDAVNTGETALSGVHEQALPAIMGIDAARSVRLGFYLRFGELFNSDPIIASVSTVLHSEEIPGWFVGEPTLSWRLDENDVTFYLYDESADTVLASWSVFAAPDWSIGTWVHIGVVAQSAPGGFFSCYINGERVLRYDTDFLQGIYEVSATGLGSQVLSGLFAIDDIYVDASAEAEADEPPPSPRFAPLWPTAVGSLNQWQLLGGDFAAPALALRPKNNDDVPLLRAGGSDLDARFRIESVRAFDNQRVDSLVVKARAFAGPFATQASLLLRDDADNEVESDPAWVGTGPTVLRERWTQRPDGGAWDQSMADIEIGVRS